MAERIVDCADFEQHDGLFDCVDIAQVKGAYVMRISGGLGLPVVRDGEGIVTEPHIKAVPADRVVVALKDGRTLLRELICAERDGITVMSLDRSNKLSIERNDILPSFGVRVVTSIVSSRAFSPK